MSSNSAGSPERDPWFDDDDDDALEPLELGGLIWRPIAKRLAVVVAAVLAVVFVITRVVA